jgi:hypothetical protein
MRWLLLGVVLASCGGAHPPVDPALGLSLALPASMKEIDIGELYITRASVFADPQAWDSDLRAHNQTYLPEEPTIEDGLWSARMTKRSPSANDADALQIWYWRTSGVAVECSLMTTLPTPSQRDEAKKICRSVNQLDDGRLFVAFPMPAQGKRIDIHVSIADEEYSAAVNIERASDAPAWRTAVGGLDGREQPIDRNVVPGGNWFISAGSTRGVGTHYDVVARRTIGGVALVCSGDNYFDERHSRRQLALCLDLTAP